MKSYFQHTDAHTWLAYEPIRDLVKILQLQWEKGWAEHRGGNVSSRLNDEEIAAVKPLFTTQPRRQKIDCYVPELAEQIFSVSGSGCYSRHALEDPFNSLGIVRVLPSGQEIELLWGFGKQGRPTSELSTHLLSHRACFLKKDSQQRAVVHNHPPHLIALSFILPPESAAFTQALWKMMPECFVVAPEGLGVLSYMLPGSLEIAQASAELITRHRLLLWYQHGIFAVADSLEESFSLIDAMEKGAEIFLKILSAGGIKQPTRTKEEFEELRSAFQLEADLSTLHTEAVSAVASNGLG